MRASLHELSVRHGSKMWQIEQGQANLKEEIHRLSWWIAMLDSEMRMWRIPPRPGGEEEKKA